MNPKNAIRVLLLSFAIGSLVYMGVREFIGGGGPAQPQSIETGLVVYYFDNDINCSSCVKLEAYALEALETSFPDEMATGAIQWRLLDMDESENDHYLIEFELFSKSVVLAKFENGKQVRWKNLEDIWELVYDKPAYMEYVRANVQEFLQAAP